MDLVPAGDARVVLVSAPPGEAHELARRLVEARLAACVNLVPGLRSVYRWDERVHDDPESLLLIKTTQERLPELAAALHEHHPYEVPEALIVAPEAGAEAYLAWLRGAVARPAP